MEDQRGWSTAQKYGQNPLVPSCTFLSKSTPSFWWAIRIWVFAIQTSHRLSICDLRGFFWLLCHVIYLKLTIELQECLLSQASIFEWWIIVIPKKAIWHFGKIVLVNLSRKSFRSLKSKPFSQFFLVRGKSERIDKI